MEHFIATHPMGGYGRNAYRLDNYGLDRELERRRYRDYMSFFQIESEEATVSISPSPEKRMGEAAAVDF